MGPDLDGQRRERPPGYLIERSETRLLGFQAPVFGATATNGTSWTDDDLTPNTTYWYRVRPANGSCASYSNVATVSVGLAYCVPEYFQTCAAGNRHRRCLYPWRVRP